MSPLEQQNVGHSVFERLKRQARERGEDLNLVLKRYGIERLLYRLSISEHRERFILKGASMFLVWLGQDYRPTQDADMLGFGPSDVNQIQQVFQELCEIKPDDDDGIAFDPGSISVEPIREEQAYGGQRVTLKATVHSANIALQVDLGFGDAVTPTPEQIEYPTRLEFPAPKLLAYPKDTLVAEKLEAMVSLGIANSRLKDFYDVWLLSQKASFNGSILREAIRATFERRGTVLPDEAPLALTEEFAGDHRKQAQWQAFITRHEPDEAPADLSEAVVTIREFLLPVLITIASEAEFRKTWVLGDGWR